MENTITHLESFDFNLESVLTWRMAFRFLLAFKMRHVYETYYKISDVDI